MATSLSFEISRERAASTARSLPPWGGGLGRGVSPSLRARSLPLSLSLSPKGRGDAGTVSSRHVVAQHVGVCA